MYIRQDPDGESSPTVVCTDLGTPLITSMFNTASCKSCIMHCSRLLKKLQKCTSPAPKVFVLNFQISNILGILHWESALAAATMPCCRSWFLKIWFLDFQSSTFKKQHDKIQQLSMRTIQKKRNKGSNKDR